MPAILKQVDEGWGTRDELVQLAEQLGIANKVKSKHRKADICEMINEELACTAQPIKAGGAAGGRSTLPIQVTPAYGTEDELISLAEELGIADMISSRDTKPVICDIINEELRSRAGAKKSAPTGRGGAATMPASLKGAQALPAAVTPSYGTRDELLELAEQLGISDSIGSTDTKPVICDIINDELERRAVGHRAKPASPSEPAPLAGGGAVDSKDVRSADLRKSHKYYNHQDEVWEANKNKDLYTGWTYEKFHKHECPYQIDHIIELQVIGYAMDEAGVGKAYATRFDVTTKKLVAGKLRDEVQNEPDVMMNVTCEKINRFKGGVFTTHLRKNKTMSSADAVEVLNEGCEESYGSPVFEHLAEEEGSKREAKDAIVAKITEQTGVKFHRLPDIVSGKDRGTSSFSSR